METHMFLKTVQVKNNSVFYKVVKDYIKNSVSFELDVCKEDDKFELFVKTNGNKKEKIGTGNLIEAVNLAQEIIGVINAEITDNYFSKEQAFGVHCDILLDGKHYYLVIKGFVNSLKKTIYNLSWKVKPVKEINKDIIACGNIDSYAILIER